MRVVAGLLLAAVLVQAIQADDSSKKNAITGYGEYALGTPVTELDLSTFTRMDSPVKGLRLYIKPDELHLSGIIVKPALSLWIGNAGDRTKPEELVGISLLLTRGDEGVTAQEDVWEVSSELYSAFLLKYEGELVVGDTFEGNANRPGLLWLKDKASNHLILLTRKDTVLVSYGNNSFSLMLLAGIAQSSRKTDDKL